MPSLGPLLFRKLKTTVIPASELSEDLCRRWREIQGQNADLASPFFAPEFTKAVGAVRADARVAVIEDGGKIRAFFAYHPGKLGFGRPIGEGLSDYHGLVASGEFDMPHRQLLRDTGLVAWDFNHAPASQKMLRRGMKLESSSPVMDLSGGYEAYVDARRAAGSEIFRKCANFLRRIEREHGPVRFVARSDDPTLLESCMDLKGRQYLRGNNADIFQIRWIRSLMEALFAISSDGLSGMVSALFAGESIVSLHLGIRSRDVWHYWFPAYDAEFSKYSPGILLLLKMAEACEEMGVKTIDLGQGNASYKMRLCTGANPLIVGSFERPSVPVFARSAFDCARRGVRKTPAIHAWRALAHWMKSRR